MNKYNKENLEKIIKISINKTDVLKKLGNKISGGNFNTLTKYIQYYKIDISHFVDNNSKIRTKNFPKGNFTKIDINDILIKNSKYSSTHHLKNRLYNEGLKERICEKCGQNENWNGERISLIIDHINGDRFDNRLENLRILCPNCNATLPTHCGKNRKNNKKKNLKKEKKIKKKLKKEKKCICGKIIYQKSNMCIDCYSIKRRKSIRPKKEELIVDIKNLGYKGTGRKYNVSDNTIRKWLKKYEKEYGDSERWVVQS